MDFGAAAQGAFDNGVVVPETSPDPPGLKNVNSDDANVAPYEHQKEVAMVIGPRPEVPDNPPDEFSHAGSDSPRASIYLDSTEAEKLAEDLTTRLESTDVHDIPTPYEEDDVSDDPYANINTTDDEDYEDDEAVTPRMDRGHHHS